MLQQAQHDNAFAFDVLRQNYSNSNTMLKKELRIRKQKDFDRIFDEGAYFSSKFLAMKVVENGMEISRFGFIVSNKVSKKAAKRNRIKRLLREAVRLRRDEIKVGFDVVFIFRDSVADKKFDEVSEVVEMLLKKSGLLGKKHYVNACLRQQNR